MSTYHYQCQYCLCTTNLWHTEDGSDAFYGGAIEDCGCQKSNYPDDDDDDD
jgi:hypothetical protein